MKGWSSLTVFDCFDVCLVVKKSLCCAVSNAECARHGKRIIIFAGLSSFSSPSGCGCCRPSHHDVPAHLEAASAECLYQERSCH